MWITFGRVWLDASPDTVGSCHMAAQQALQRVESVVELISLQAPKSEIIKTLIRFLCL